MRQARAVPVTANVWEGRAVGLALPGHGELTIRVTAAAMAEDCGWRWTPDYKFEKAAPGLLQRGELTVRELPRS
jgi:hypothetical protein